MAVQQSAKGNPASKRMSNPHPKQIRIRNKAANESVKKKHGGRLTSKTAERNYIKQVERKNFKFDSKEETKAHYASKNS